MELSGTYLTTMEPAAMTEFAPIVKPFKIETLLSIQTFFFIMIGDVR